MADKNEIGIPNKSSFMNAVKGYGYGAVGGIAYNLFSGLLGSSLLGSVGAAVLAGAFLKGDEGKMLTTIIGFQAVMLGNLNFGNILGGSQTAAADDTGTI